MKTILHLASCICLAAAALAIEPDVILDAHDSPSPVNYSSGAWQDETPPTNAFRNNSKYLSNANSSHHATFHTTLPSVGPWQVFVWHNLVGSGATQNAQVTHEDGTTTVTYVQSSTNVGQWVLLGTFWFNTTAEAQVKLIGSYGKLSVDAVRFALAKPDIVLDAGGTAQSGVSFSNSAHWTSVTSYLAGNLQNLRRGNTAGATVTFQPVLPVGGDYEIAIWVPPGIAHDQPGTWLPTDGTAAGSFDVDVYARGGAMTTHTVTVPALGRNEGSWVQIGTGPFRLDASPNANPARVVVKTNGTSGQYVPADAVRWTKTGSSLFMDEDDPAGPPGTVASPNPGAWAVTGQQAAVPFTGYGHPPYGLGAKSVNFGSSQSSLQKMIYTPGLAQMGLYDVYLWYPAVLQSGYYYSPSMNNPVVQVKIHTALGDFTKTVNQRVDTGKWAHLGRYILYPGDDPVTTNRPWLQIATPENPHTPGSYQYNSWWYTNSGHVFADGVLFLRDNEDADVDGDGLPEWHEILLLTNTSTQDLNGDGIPDGYDTDNDGTSDGEEYLAGTSSFDPRPQLTLIDPSDATLN